MGRVHKKKLAQYNKENGDGKDGALDNSTNGDEKSSDRSRAESDADESIASSKKRTPKSTPVVDDKAHDDEEEQIDDIDRSDKRNDIADDGRPEDDDTEVNKSSPIGKKTAQKRKASARSKNDDVDDADEVETNGPTPAKKSAAKKNAGKKVKAKPKSKKQKVESEDDGDENGEDADADGDQEYEVEDVVDYKVEKGLTYYLIRWKGYGPNDDTWEEERTLSCQDLIDKFNKKKKTTKSPKPKPASKKAAGSTKASPEKKDAEDPEKQWEVDKIIDFSDEKKGRLFRIRWKGYSAKFDTWEPEEHLNCDELIQKFLKKVESQKNISFKELREEPKKTKRMVSEGFLKAEKGARKSKRGTGKQRIQYADSD